jgi:hypothetical protein
MVWPLEAFGQQLFFSYAQSIVLKTGPDRRLNRIKPEPKPASVFLAHWTACAYEPG